MLFNRPNKRYRPISFASIFLAVASAHIIFLCLAFKHKVRDPSTHKNVRYLETYSIQSGHSYTKGSFNQHQLVRETRIDSATAGTTPTPKNAVLANATNRSSIIPIQEQHALQPEQPLTNKKNQSQNINNSKVINKDAFTIAEASSQTPIIHAAYLNNPAPIYPRISRRLGEQGVVLLAVEIDVDGSASKVKVQTSSGHPRLDKSALETVLKWRFIPGKKAGVPQKMLVNIPINFVLE